MTTEQRASDTVRDSLRYFRNLGVDVIDLIEGLKPMTVDIVRHGWNGFKESEGSVAVAGLLSDGIAHKLPATIRPMTRRSPTREVIEDHILAISACASLYLGEPRSRSYPTFTQFLESI